MERLGNHPNVISFVGAITMQHANFNNVALVVRLKLLTVMTHPMLNSILMLQLEYCARGSIYDLLVERKEQVPLVRLVAMARDISAGILHLHK